MSILILNTISKRYRGQSNFAVKEVSMKVRQGDIVALVGESGSGKSTLLRIIAGLEHPQSGSMELRGQEIVSGAFSVPPHKRDIGLMFQDYALFPHLTIFDNIAYGLPKLPRASMESEVRDLMKLVGLSEDWHKYPAQLSGGQQQRVALARALAPKPTLLLLDEPFSNLDAILREQVRQEIRAIIKTTGTTAIMVTHDTKDALSIADQIAVMHQGELLQQADPKTIHDRPELAYVAELFGKFNLMSVQKEGACYRCAFGCLFAPKNTDSSSAAETENAELFFRPNQIQIVEDPSQLDPSDLYLTGIIKDTIYVGSGWEILVEAPNPSGKATKIWIYSDNLTRVEPGEELHFKVSHCHWWESQVDPIS